jgi:hypothetical protein
MQPNSLHLIGQQPSSQACRGHATGCAQQCAGISPNRKAGRRYTLKTSSVDWSARSAGKCRLELVDAATGAQSPLVMRLKQKTSEEFICKQ